MSETTSAQYVPFDQDEKLPPPPWRPTDPALIAWEAAHGHDVRLKCYPEFGCRVIESSREAEVDRLTTELANLRAEVRRLDLSRTTLRSLDGPPEAAVESVDVNVWSAKELPLIYALTEEG